MNLERGYRGGWWPPCRAARYLGRLEPREGPSLHDHWFRLAVDEARRDGTASVLCPRLDEAKTAYGRLIAAARSLANHDGGEREFGAARIELQSVAGELMRWTKSPNEANETRGDTAAHDASTTADSSDSDAKRPDGAERARIRPATVNQRMAGEIMVNPEAMGWSCSRWAEHLKCARSTVVEAATWKRLENARQQAKAERMKDRRRKPKASDLRRE